MMHVCDENLIQESMEPLHTQIVSVCVWGGGGGGGWVGVEVLVHYQI